uniref:DUF805 domain-containing protein n=1 Tax=Streptomyces sp. NRRL B-24085 TaxID=1709476 RepID=UPI00117C571F
MNYFLDVLKKYAVFSGRARRKEYWMYTLFVAIIYIVLAVIGVVQAAHEDGEAGEQDGDVEDDRDPRLLGHDTDDGQ